jgi:hypothetical protein
MALQSSGPISASQIRNEFAGVTQVSFSKYFRHAEPTDGLEVFSGTYTSANNSGVPTSGAIKFSDFYSKYREVLYVAGSPKTNLVTSTIFSDYWTTNVPKRLRNESTIGATSTGNAALTVSASVSGSIVIVNNGNIQGAGGAAGAIGADGGNGGNAIFLSSSCSITNTGTIYAGGGGGGGGTAGGAGGNGGSGSYNTTASSTFQGRDSTNSCQQSCDLNSPSGAFGVGCQSCNSQFVGTFPYGYTQYNCASCFYSYYVLNSSTGGTGGTGGNGGNGGVGQGYDQTKTNAPALDTTGGPVTAPALNTTGGPTSGSGTHAGNGAAGGNGGLGGNGGDWGTAGGDGVQGTKGSNGGNGYAADGNTVLNNGVTGSFGATPIAKGGSPGYSIVNSYLTDITVLDDQYRTSPYKVRGTLKQYAD